MEYEEERERKKEFDKEEVMVRVKEQRERVYDSFYGVL